MYGLTVGCFLMEYQGVWGPAVLVVGTVRFRQSA